MVVTMLVAVAASIGLLFASSAPVKPADSGPPISCGVYGGSPTVVCD